MLTLGPVTPDAPGFELLHAESLAQGHRMLQRFAESWRSGDNRFAQPGECITGVCRDGVLIGVCGRNRDPYDPHPGAGRVRHLYVALAHRRTGIGRMLMHSIIEGAATWFDYLNTNSPPESAAFYERMGFVPISADHITHRLDLRHDA